jgi:hypothetical protein
MKHVKTKGLCVTFVGMSGVGKTAVAQELRNIMKEQKCDFASWDWMLESDFLKHSKLKRRIFPLLYALKKPRSLKVIVNLIFIFCKLGPLRLTSEDREHYFDTIRIFLIRNFVMRRTARMYLFDEAVLNSVLSRIDAAKIDRVMDDLVRTVLWDNLTTVFVFASTSAPTAIRRLISAGYTGNGSDESRAELRDSNAAREEYRTKLDNYIVNGRRFEYALRRFDGARAIHIDTTTMTPRENAEKILSFIRTITNL